ncbi:MAG TPA: phosphatase PAP2 family protein [Steroidobacteraceae bacterium]|jgi:membrane-associated PAP2 superfamily phosphatase|nr:phosphatase PAP2 family protein [Steroidobacteraceae bacterium]
MDHSSNVLAPRPLALPGRENRLVRDSTRDFWRNHAWWPLLVFAVVFAAVEVFSLDRVLAEHWYFNVQTGQWLGAGAGDWWAHRLLHTGGGLLVRAVGAAALVLWGLTFAIDRLRPWRRSAGFVLLAMVLSTGIVGGLKAVTNVDCPWDLLGFGGHNPYVSLFADRPDALPQAKCFPGAHAASGFALVCFYFLLRDRSRRLGHWALAVAIAVGVAFSIGQEARGAHFFSHDLVSAAIVWFVQLGLYARLSRRSPDLVTQLVPVRRT